LEIHVPISGINQVLHAHSGGKARKSAAQVQLHIGVYASVASFLKPMEPIHCHLRLCPVGVRHNGDELITAVADDIVGSPEVTP
jgi:hypothetical protein